MKLNSKIGAMALMISIPLEVGADLLPHRYKFPTKVLSVHDFGLLEVQGIGLARLWGVIPGKEFVNFAEQNLVGKQVSCDNVGDTFTHKLKIFDDVRKTISCAADMVASHEFENRSHTLQEFLIDIGVAEELCAETLGLFGHCNRSSGN